MVRNDSIAKAATTTPPHEDWVDVVRLVGIVLIVIVHVLNPDRRLATLTVGSVGWIGVDAITAGTRWALPMFVMISGYLLLDPQKRLNWDTYYHRRMQRIAWPLLAWSVFYLCLVVCGDHIAGRPVDVAKMVGLLIKGAPYYHLWYIYMLLGLYIACPFIKLATDQMNPSQLTGAVALCFAVTVFSSSVDGMYSISNASYIDDFPRYLGYLLAGHLLGRVMPLPRIVPTSPRLRSHF